MSSLYRKYRPLDFDALLGQDHIRDVLTGALQKGKVSHAYLFTGPRGTGKTSTARILARAINCLNLAASGPCNTCDICKASLEERLTDIIEIDAASHGLVDDARALVEQAAFLPNQSKKKVYIIDEVHMLSKSAFNALLKIIEEPPDHVHFILATTEPHKVLETIRSRCQRFDFHLADDTLIAAHLSQVCHWEGVAPQESALDLLASSGKGSFRDALSLLEQMIGFGDFTLAQVREVLGLTDRQSVDQFLAALDSGNTIAASQIIATLYQEGYDLSHFCESILHALREKLFVEGSDHQRLLSWIEIFFHALDQLKDPVIPELPLELAVMRITTSSKHSSLPLPSEPLRPSEKKDPVSSEMEKLLEIIDHVPLRRLLKDSQLHFDGKELSIIARTEFEQKKIKAPDNIDHLTRALRTLSKDPIIIHCDCVKKRPLQENELRGIFKS